MPLPGIPTLKSQIIEAINQSQDVTEFDDALEIFALNLATIIDSYIRAGDVVTVGSATTQTGKMT